MIWNSYVKSCERSIYIILESVIETPEEINIDIDDLYNDKIPEEVRSE